MVETTLKSGTETYSSAIEDARNYTRWIISRFEPYFGDHLLEVGVGHGGYRKYLPESKSYVGVDIDVDAVHAARKSDPNGQYFELDISDSSGFKQFSGITVDTILCVNVLEHVPEDRSAVENLLSILRPGGHLLIFVPALQFLYGSMDELAGHCRRYSKSSFAKLVPGDSAKIVKMEYFNSIGAFAWWLNGRFKYQSLDHDAINDQIRIFDRYVVPLSRTCDIVLKPFFGQSFIAIIEKQ